MDSERKKEGFSDDEVIRSVKRGKTEDYEVIVRRYNTRIINFIFRMTGDMDESRSIAQDVFLRIYTKLNKYRENGTFQAFIFTIARNLTLNHIKKMARVSFFPGNSEKGDGDHLPSDNRGPEEEEEKSEQERYVLEGLQNLSVNQRLALVMKVYLGYSYKTMAEMTGWSRPKIETLISRGKMNLKKYVMLQEKGEKSV